MAAETVSAKACLAETATSDNAPGPENKGNDALIGRRLSDLRPTERAYITGFERGLPETVQRRLRDLGIEDGATIELLRRAPLGDPSVFRVRNYDLCLRRRESSRVRCEMIRSDIDTPQL